jgi:hypothetical protein
MIDVDTESNLTTSNVEKPFITELLGPKSKQRREAKIKPASKIQPIKEGEAPAFTEKEKQFLES